MVQLMGFVGKWTFTINLHYDLLLRGLGALGC